jgi:hypothetical protein
MMNHMQSGDLVILLAQDKEKLPQQNTKVNVYGYQMHSYFMLLVIVIGLTVSNKSVNLLRKYHQQQLAICIKDNY